MNIHKPIYLDNAATTPIDNEVLDVVTDAYKSFWGNPSSIHAIGRKAKAALEQARRQIASIIGAAPGEIYFTSSGTEANNTALLGAVRDLGVKHIVTSKLEHPSVLQMIEFLQVQYQNLNIHWVQTDQFGAPLLSHLEDSLEQIPPKQGLVSLMHANNETGTLADIVEIGNICKEKGLLFHTDCVQTTGYYPIDVSLGNIHFLSASAHKFHGPRGIGFLYMNNNTIVKPLLYGGGQERGMRSSTEHVSGALGMAHALKKMVASQEELQERISQLSTYLIRQLIKHIPSCEILHHDISRHHYKIVSIMLPDTPKAALAIMNLDIAGICVSGGSACSSGVEKKSHVMDALYPDDHKKHLRISFSHHNTKDEIDYFIQQLALAL